MSAVLVTVILDRFDGAENAYVKGTASWTPSLEFPDPADQMLIGQAPVTATFRAGSLPEVTLIANDTAGPQGDTLPGWTWNVTYSGVPGSPADASYYILSTNGGTQRLSSLASVPAAQPGQQYVPLPDTPPGDDTLVLGLSSASPLVPEWVAGGGGGGGSGTVTGVSVVSANGLAGSVANHTTTPAITLETTVTGLLKGNGTAVSAASAGTDYLAPNGSGAALTGITAAQVGADASGAAAAVQANLTTEVSRAEAAEALLAPLADPAFTGTVTVPSTVNATDAAQKQYVDSVAQGLDNKPSVTALAAANITLSGTQTIDGVAVTAGQRVLAAGQSTASQNGLWVVASGSWTRPADFASGSTQLGASAFVEAGTSFGSSGWVLSGATAVTVDTSSQTWTQFSGAGEVNAGTGLSKSGNTISLSTPVSLADGGTGQATQQAALDALAGAVTSGQVLRGNGTHVVLAAIQAADVPVLNQDTTGSAAKVNGASVPLSKTIVGTNGSGQIVDASAATLANNTSGNAGTATNLAGGATFPDYVAPATVALTDGSSVALNAALGNDFSWPLGGSSHTLALPSNPVNRQLIVVWIKYSGSYTPLFNAGYDFGAAGQPAWSAASGKTDCAAWRYNSALAGASGAWAYQGCQLGLTS